MKKIKLKVVIALRATTRNPLMIVASLLFTTVISVYAEDDVPVFNPLRTGVPSLTIAPDARGGAMGDIGAATEPDVFSQYWNPAKYAFASSKGGVSLSYTPWLSKLVDDINLVYASGYYKLGNSENLALGASIRYFSLGNIPLIDRENMPLGETKPYEMAADISLSMKTSETFSLAAAFRYIRSDLGAGIDEELEAGTAVAADIAGYYNKYVNLGSSECLLGLGFNISNIGPKISYDGGNTNVFLPTNMRLGASLLMPLDDYNTLSFNADINKYLVPTPPITDGMTPDEAAAAWEKYNDKSPISGIFSSFNDAPGGMKEELKEIMWSVGAEYAYDRKFFARGGYFYENKSKGNRQYFSLGAGFKLSAFQLDVAYLISTVASNPLDQTLRFSLSFDMDGMRSLMQ
ncbi:MAG: type IX secretion system outer membrane channel protein PorV [Candidatus Symbiothrix sp.]|nr:type IX secretion system outer membrane channel protein PorV [Candidatus Symbiothrix sp.]